MHHRTGMAALVAALALTGCSSSQGSSDKSSDNKQSALSDEWIPKLETATTTEDPICNEVGDQACAEHLTGIALLMTDLREAIDEAGGLDAYPRTVREIAKIDEAVEACTEHECLADENAGNAGSPCPDDVYTIRSGGDVLPFALQVDELKGN
ncbi:hypothetical protein ACN6K6_004720 [Streptomyces violaceoruber]|uniref:hypothetical protein n=1 Tax=Streptomyces violaceoruber TaxID=1935 RepID=UPI00403D4A76